MEEEQGEDSEVLDAMDGWDSEEENQSSGGAQNNNGGSSPAADTAADSKKWVASINVSVHSSNIERWESTNCTSNIHTCLLEDL